MQPHNAMFELKPVGGEWEHMVGYVIDYKVFTQCEIIDTL